MSAALEHKIDIQARLNELHRVPEEAMWAGAPNAWVRALSPSAVGTIGEALALKVLGGTATKNNTIGYDIDLDGKRIEVKLSTVVMSNGYPILRWRQIRPNDPYTHICFIAVYPHKARMFLVPKEAIPNEVLKHQHGRGQSLDLFHIHARRIDTLFPWMVAHEV